MMRLYCILSVMLLFQLCSTAQTAKHDPVTQFQKPPASAKPWVLWYWMHAAVSKQGITADLEAMKEVGIGGAYIVSVKDTLSSIPFKPAVRQLSKEWWEMVRFAMQEAKRLKLELGFHVSDGFALAGGPWITPDLSMQKLVWTKTWVAAGQTNGIKLQQPAAKENYYKEVAVFAFPSSAPNTDLPVVTTSTGADAAFLPIQSVNKTFRSDTACWIQYRYARPFTLRSLTVNSNNNYQSLRLTVQASDDGKQFRTIGHLEPPRAGWQDTDEDYTYALPATTAGYFRFVWDKAGSEPGAEDLDAAKWKAVLRINGIYASDEAVIHQYQAKNGSVWRVAANTTEQQVTKEEAVSWNTIVDLTKKMDADGKLDWTPPASSKGGWTIVRIGHTSNGHTNYTGGAALGLECDKFNPAAIKKQFDNWYAKAFETDEALAKDVLKMFYIDSWECGSQNWSPLFAAEFRKRRGYDLHPWLLVMAGIPVKDASASEKVLHDVRQTIAELVNEVFYVTLKNLSRQKGTLFTAESVAPTMVSDGMLHYSTVDIPMGEFWLNSPTHDKPNDMLDAIHAGHVYGKRIIQSESYTSVRMNWAEHPGNLKIVGDRNFALGINKMVMHVFTQNPWLNKKPGMTLDGVGLYFQRDQTWFRQGKAWMEYLTRCAALLQLGEPVTDIAVFTGEEVPRRSVLPDRLVGSLPGIIGAERVERERLRLLNIDEPLRQIPDGVSHSANMADPEDWIDPLNGYAYDSFNPDALMKMTVKNGRVVLPGGASYAVLVFPGKHPMQPNYTLISAAVAKKLLQLVNEGATILIHKDYKTSPGLKDGDIKPLLDELFNSKKKKGRVILLPYTDSSFEKMGLEADLKTEDGGAPVAWNHRRQAGADIYFISNQENAARKLQLSLRVKGKDLRLFDPVTGEEVFEFHSSLSGNDRTGVALELAPAQSLFLIFNGPLAGNKSKMVPFLPPVSNETTAFNRQWSLQFDTAFGGKAAPVAAEQLSSWSESLDSSIKYYSGTVVYTNYFNRSSESLQKRTFIALDSVFNIATIRVNGIDCGALWTPPYSVEITKALKEGENRIEIEVANTWHNRLIGDQFSAKKITWTTAPFRLKGKPLQPAGIIGNIRLITR